MNKQNEKSAAEVDTELLRRIEQWQDVCLHLSHDAALGRLFRGTIHNLNGVTQAFSMQAELLGMMFNQAEVMLRYMLAGTEEPEIKKNLLKLQKLMNSRTSLVVQMKEKVILAGSIVSHYGNIPQYDNQDERHETVNSIIEVELEFLNADSFFKHKVKKNLSLADNLPRIKSRRMEMRQIIFPLLLNGLEAMQQAGGKAVIKIMTKLENENIKVEITDSGSGILPEHHPQIFNAFFSTKEDHPGVGLYVVKKLTKRCGGIIDCVSRPGSTCFRLSFPVEKL